MIEHDYYYDIEQSSFYERNKFGIVISILGLIASIILGICSIEKEFKWYVIIFPLILGIFIAYMHYLFKYLENQSTTHRSLPS